MQVLLSENKTEPQKKKKNRLLLDWGGKSQCFFYAAEL